jgi:hypothetical protein
MRRLQLKLSQPRCQSDVAALGHSLRRYARAARKRRSQQ